MPFAESPATIYRGIRVRLPDGTTRESLSVLAREIGCKPQALRRHIVDHAEGCAILGSLPDPRRCGPNHPKSKEHDVSTSPMTSYTIEPFIGAESGAAAAEGCHTYSLKLTLADGRRYLLGSFEDGDQLAVAVAEARSNPATLLPLLAQTIDTQVHTMMVWRDDGRAAVKRCEERLAIAEPAASDLGGRVAGALGALREAGRLIEAGESTAAWLAVIRAADALERPGGITQEAAALRGVDAAERFYNEPRGAWAQRDAAVVSCSWDERLGAWYVECRIDRWSAIYGVRVTAEGAEVIDEQ